MKIRILAGILLMTALGATGWLYMNKGNKVTFVENNAIDSTGNANVGGPFTLTDQNGRTRTNKEFLGKLMLVYFGYTYCPDICPMALENITLALKQLGRDRDKISTIFITIDPERDTQEVLHIYGTNFDPSILMLTGPKKTIKEAMYHYGVYARQSKEEGSTDYLVDHSTLIYLMDASGKFIHHFNHTVNPDHLAKVLKKEILKLKTDEIKDKRDHQLKQKRKAA